MPHLFVRHKVADFSTWKAASHTSLSAYLVFAGFLVAAVNRLGLLRMALTRQSSLLALFCVRSYYQMEEKQDQTI
jgi:hypothetical protein